MRTVFTMPSGRSIQLSGEVDLPQACVTHKEILHYLILNKTVVQVMDNGKLVARMARVHSFESVGGLVTEINMIPLDPVPHYRKRN